MKKALFEVDEQVIIYTDGGSRGNPGPAALGVVVNGREYGEYLGTKTNNQAEYAALIFALKKVKQLVGKKKAKETELEIRMDSELVVRQMNAEYKIEEPDLQMLFMEVWNLRLDFKSAVFTHIPREKNRIADGIVNKVLDSKT